MGSAAGMNASIKANAELRRRKRRNSPFYKIENELTEQNYKLAPLSKYENKKVRDIRSRKILREEYQKRIVGILVILPMIWFVQFLLSLLIDWL